MPVIDPLAVVYSAYAALSVALTVWLARTLARNGRVFLDDVFTDNPALARSVNQLLVVGFYLANIGYACVLLEGGRAHDVRTAMEVLASKMGSLLLSLAAMHFMNMFVLHRIRRRAQVRAAQALDLRGRGAPTPLPPTGYLTAAEPHPATSARG